MERDVAGDIFRVYSGLITIDAVQIDFAAQAFSIAESATGGASVGTLDASASDDRTITFAAAHPVFNVDGNTGEITLAAGQSLDHETTASYVITVTADALDVEPVTQSITINVDDVLENAITFAAETFSIAEDAASGDLVGTLNASASPAGTVTFTATHPVFDVASTGEITLAAGQSLDHETTASYAIAVTASADDAPDVAESITINVDDVPENAITFAAETFSVAEDATPGDLVGTLAASTSPAGTVTFTATHAVFDVASTGEITLKTGPSLDHEAQDTYTIEVTAGADDAPDVTQSITINVGNLLENVITFATSPLSIAENVAIGTLVSTLSASVSPTGTVTFAADAAAPFAVANTGEITTVAAIDYETTTSYAITVTASALDAEPVTKIVVIKVDNEIDQTITFPPPSLSIAENAVAGTSAGTLSASASPAGTVTFTATHPVFDVASTGKITLKAGQNLDYEVQNTYTIEVTANADDAPNFVQNVIVSVVNIDQEGTADEPYQIDTLAELQSIATGFQNDALDAPRSVADSLAAHYALAANLDASATATWNDDGTDTSVYEGFLPIGNCGADNTCRSNGDDEDGDESEDNQPFSGGFNGAGYTIDGLVILRASTDGVALFGIVSSEATIEAVSLTNADVTGLQYVGALVGDNDGTVQNSSASGSVQGTDVIGGLIGGHEGTAQASSAEVSVAGSSVIGGLVGGSSGTIKDSSASGSVDATGTSSGGLVGGSSGTIQDSSASGDVSGGTSVGGLVGSIIDGGTVQGSTATGNVDGASSTGGLAGSSDGTVRDSSATGDVSAEGDDVGGLVGFNDGGTIEASHASGEVEGGNDYVGGLVGQNDDGTVTDSYATGAVSGAGNSVGGLVGENKIAQQRHGAR